MNGNIGNLWDVGQSSAADHVGSAPSGGDYVNHSSAPSEVPNFPSVSESSYNWTGTDHGNFAMSTEGVDSEEEEAMTMEDSSENNFYAQQISLTEYEQQTTDYTKAAVETLIQSPEYQRRFTMCQLCWCSWSEEQFTVGCSECGGFGMKRPCPICNGKCQNIWTRDVQLSHDFNESHWDGECGLPPDERRGFMVQALMDEACEDSVCDGMEDLSTL